jgi:hypothetical protein
MALHPNRTISYFKKPKPIESLGTPCYELAMPAQGYALLSQFFQRALCAQATAPLKQGVEMAVSVDGDSEYTLQKTANGLVLLESTATNPHLSFKITPAALSALSEETFNDVGELGIALVKLIVSTEPEKRLDMKVHLGPMDLFLNGYFSVLALGGPGFMKFLATKGFSGIAQVKEALSRFRG